MSHNRSQPAQPTPHRPLPATGVACGAAASGHYQWNDPQDIAKLLTCMMMSGPLLTGYTQTINDWYDREIDAINEPYRPIPSGERGCRGTRRRAEAAYLNAVCFNVLRWQLHALSLAPQQQPNCSLWALAPPSPSGRISESDVIAQIWVLLLGGLGVAYGLDKWAGHETPTLLILAIFGSFISYIYSAPPLKLKQSGWAGNYALGSSYIALPWWAGQVGGQAGGSRGAAGARGEGGTGERAARSEERVA